MKVTGKLPNYGRLALSLCLLFASTLVQANRLEVEIQGVDEEVLDNVEALLSIWRTSREDRRPHTREIQRLHRRAPDEIREALQPFGYYEPNIRSALTEPREGRWLAVYEIEPGEPTQIESVDVRLMGEGRDDPRLAAAIDELPVQVGNRLHHPDYEQSKKRLLQAALRIGFLDARLTRQSLRVYPIRRSAEVDIEMDTGTRFYFGKVEFRQDVLYDERLQRYVPFAPGDELDVDRLLKLQFLMNDLDYYNQVEVDLDRDNTSEDGRVPVIVRAEPRPPQRYSIGVGYGTDTGPRFSLGVEFRRLNKSGHRMRNDLRIAERKSSFTSQYMIPIGDRVGDSVTLAASKVDEELGDGESDQLGLGISRNSLRAGWQERIYLNFEREDFTVGDRLTRTDVLMPGVSYSRTETSDLVQASDGWNVFIDLHGAQRDLLSDTSFLQLRSRLKTVLSLGSRARLLTRFEAGVSIVDRFSELPGSQRFFAGGDQSVRGYAYQSLGPVDADGNVIGGEYLQTFSVEVDRRIGNNWGLALFYDVGSASTELGEDLKRGAGAGYRLRTPVGMIRVDLAHPLDADSPDVRLHLGIGAEL